jgi:hypothetical protein
LISVANLDRRSPLAKLMAFIYLVAICAGVSACARDQAFSQHYSADGQTVIMLHGFGRGKASMWFLAKHIEAAGFRVIRVSYGPFNDPPNRIIAGIRPELDALCATQKRTDTLCRSLSGGLDHSWLPCG